MIAGLRLHYPFPRPRLTPQLASKQQLLIAIHQALLAWSGGKAITKTVHSEIMHCLSIGSNISESLKRHGLADTSTSVVVVHVTSNPSASTAYDLMANVVDGTLVPLLSHDDASRNIDWKRLDKVYKLSELPRGSTAATKASVIQTSLAIKSGMAL